MLECWMPRHQEVSHSEVEAVSINIVLNAYEFRKLVVGSEMIAMLITMGLVGVALRMHPRNQSQGCDKTQEPVDVP